MAGNREFYYRRLHSLLVVIPVGIFLVQHLV
ncbi:succinate dehydrogenase, partial [Parageobacillus sp. SY1]